MKFFVVWMLIGGLLQVAVYLIGQARFGAKGFDAAIRVWNRGRWAWLTWLTSTACWPLHIAAFFYVVVTKKQIIDPQTALEAVRAQRAAENLCQDCGEPLDHRIEGE